VRECDINNYPLNPRVNKQLRDQSCTTKGKALKQLRWQFSGLMVLIRTGQPWR
jgi:hypothetical protein